MSSVVARSLSALLLRALSATRLAGGPASAGAKSAGLWGGEAFAVGRRFLSSRSVPLAAVDLEEALRYLATEISVTSSWTSAAGPARSTTAYSRYLCRIATGTITMPTMM